MSDGADKKVMIELVHVTKTYQSPAVSGPRGRGLASMLQGLLKPGTDARVVVDDLNLRVREGELLALLGGSVGYILGSSAWGLIGGDPNGFIAFGIGLVVAVALAIAVLALNVPKLLVIVLTGLGGAATILAGWFILTGAIPTDNIHWTTVGKEILDSWFWLIVWGVIAAAGMLAQLRAPTFGPDSYELSRTSYRYS